MPHSTLICEIHAPRAAEAGALAEIAKTVAREIGQPLAVRMLAIGPRSATRTPLLTLLLPAELAACQHEAWCLACRLACFCPNARVSVLIRGREAFAQPAPDHRLDRSA